MTNITLGLSDWQQLREAKNMFDLRPWTPAEHVSSLLRHLNQAFRERRKESPTLAIERLMKIACSCAAWAGMVSEDEVPYRTVLAGIGQQLMDLDDDDLPREDDWLPLLTEHIGQAGAIDEENSALLCIALTRIAAEALIWAGQIRQDSRPDQFFTLSEPVTLSFGGGASSSSSDGGSAGSSGYASGGNAVGSSGSAGGGGWGGNAGGTGGGGAGGAVARPVPPLPPWVLSPYVRPTSAATSSLYARLRDRLDTLEHRARWLHSQGHWTAAKEIWQAYLNLARELDMQPAWPDVEVTSAKSFERAMAPVWSQIEEQQKDWAESMGRVLHEALINGFSSAAMRPGDVLSRYEGGSYLVASELARQMTVHWTMEEDEYDQVWAALENAATWSPFIRKLREEGKIPGPADRETTMRLSPQDVIDRFLPGRISVMVLPPEMCDDRLADHPQHTILRESDGAVVDCPGGNSPAVRRAKNIVLCAFPDDAAALEFRNWWFVLGRDLWKLAGRPIPEPSDPKAREDYKG